MGYRLHVATKYQVRYDGFGMFNHKSEELNDLIQEYFAGTDFWSDSAEYAKDMEIPVFVFEKGIKKMRESKDTLLEGYDNKEVIDNFEYILDNYDRKNEYIHLSWF